MEYYAETIKSQFLICNTILDLNNKKIFNFIDFENIDTLFLDKILSCIFENNLTIDIIKKIARSEIWRSFWGVSKDNIFDGKIKDWTDEQRSLVNFSKVLDNIREHMESPSEEIIADDDALDGWILYQHEKQVKEKKKQQISDRYNLDKKNSDEIFILTGDKNESKTIFELNDIQTRRDLKITNKLIEDKGILQESEVPHVKRQINHQLNLMNKERIRSN